MDAATTAKDQVRIEQLANAYQRLTELGIDANLVKASVAAAADVDMKKKLERTAGKRFFRAGKVAEIIQRNPEPSRIHRAMKGHPHKAKKTQKSAE